MSSTLKVGDQVEVLIGPIANGGHFVARHNGQVIFVRHAIAGETALVEITSISSKLARADAISIIKASPDRIESICKFSGPGKCGGCDFQHINPERQRALKTEIITEQLGVDPSEVTPNASFVNDLGADSLDTVELVMALEEEFDCEIPDEDAEKITTVQNAIDYALSHKKA